MWGTHISNVMMAYTNKVKELCVQGEHYTLDQVMDIYIYMGCPSYLSYRRNNMEIKPWKRIHNEVFEYMILILKHNTRTYNFFYTSK